MNVWQWQKQRFMQQSSLMTALAIQKGPAGQPAPRIAFVGAGGKTTLLFALAAELSHAGSRVIVTTSTHIWMPEGFFVTGGDLTGAARTMAAGQVAVLGCEGSDGKLTAPAAVFLSQASSLADFVLIEADGSQGLPAKAPAAHEPVLAGDEALVVAVAGYSALRHPIGEVCCRPEHVAMILKKHAGNVLSAADLATLQADVRGGRKGVRGRFAAVLNQVNTPAELTQAARWADSLHRRMRDGRILAVGREL